MTANIHQMLIDGVLRQFPEAKTAGLWKALRAHPELDYAADLLANDKEWAQAVRFVPDAWLIDSENGLVVVFEAVHSHEVSEDKFARMVELSWALDEDYFRVLLVRCDVTGRRAYDVQWTELAMIHAGREIGDHTLWQRYTAEHCSSLLQDLPEEAAAPVEADSELADA
jgi:hypothetical protein